MLTTLFGTDADPRMRAIAFVLAVISFGIYAGTIGHDYNMDDELVTKGHRLTSKGFMAIGKIFSSPYYEDDMGYSYEYRPITHLTFAVEHGIFGERSGLSHLINVLLHSITVLLVFLVTRMMSPLGGLLFPVLAAALFAVHPMHTEVVASIKNRDELLALMFGIMALLVAVRAVCSGSVLYWPLIPLLLILSLLSKSSGAAFLFLIPTCAFLRRDCRSRNLLLLLICVTIPLGVHAFSHDMPLSWFKNVGLILIAPFLLYMFWQLAKKVDFGRILRENRPKGWPDLRSGERVVIAGGMSRSEIIVIVVTMMFAAISLVLQKPYLLMVPLGLLLSGPYWTGRHKLTHFLLACAVLALLSLHKPLFAAAFLIKLYALILCIANGYRFNRNYIILIVMAMLPGVVSEFRSIPGQWGMAVVAMSIMNQVIELTPFALTLALKGRSRSVLMAVWVLFCLVFLADLVSYLTPTAILIFSGSLVFLLYLIRWPRWLPNSLKTLAVLILVSVAVEAGRTIMDARLAEVTSVNEEEIAAIGPVESDDVAVRGLIDRPLSFVEFPLGQEADLSTRLGTASVVLGHYLRMMFIPWPQAFYYGFDEVRMVSMKDGIALISAGIHILLLLLSVIFVRSHPLLSFSMVAYLASIFLFSNLISPVAGMMGDRLTYVASFGFCMAVAYVLTMGYREFDTPVARKVFSIALAAVLVTWSGMTIARSAEWKDAITLMRHDINTVPNSAQAHNLLASHLMMTSFEKNNAREAMEMRLEAIGHFKQAVRIWPEFFNVWYDLGRSYMTVNQPDKALPAYKEAHRLDSTFYDATVNVAVISEQMGNLSQAVEYYERCIRFSPGMLEPYGNLSYLFFMEGRYEESIAVNERAIEQNPNWPDPYLNIARTYETMGMPDKAAEYRIKANRPK